LHRSSAVEKLQAEFEQAWRSFGFAQCPDTNVDRYRKLVEALIRAGKVCEVSHAQQYILIKNQDLIELRPDQWAFLTRTTRTVEMTSKILGRAIEDGADYKLVDLYKCVYHCRIFVLRQHG
jgi:hypothetical protein